ncbi:hypothetical protein AC579_8140 [Pseudocercospora musae]|uniref:Cytochrome b561 domain-containing protein n=1 Tax=Pseudocercospora musae TaxID=113226 RepID=A0A139IUH4_9PEZI|nr:hypothetical protein AC579_8140 [Pseudocercospora musae]
MSSSRAVQRLCHVVLFGMWYLVRSVNAQDGDDGSGEDAGNVKVAHAVLGSLAWVITFPAGAIAMRFAKGPKAWLVHSSIQGIGLAIVTAGAGNGIYLAKVTKQLNAYHPIIGLVLFLLVWIQATGGFLGHYLWTKSDSKTFVAHTHVWLGRALITLGMINGGLGLLLSEDASEGAYIAYGVIAGISWLLIISNAVLHEHGMGKQASINSKDEKALSQIPSPQGQDAEMQLRGRSRDL